MLTIRDTQMALFRKVAEERFAEWLEAHLREHFPGPVAALGGVAQLQEFVKRCVQRAEQARIETQASVTVLAELMVQYGGGFERSPLREWAMVILDHPTLAGDLKAEALRERHDQLTGGRVVVAY